VQESPLDAELAAENAQMAVAFAEARKLLDGDFIRTPLKMLSDLWCRLRRKPRRIIEIDREFAELSLTLAALLRSARRRGGLSNRLDGAILTSLIHEMVREPLSRIPEGSLALADTLLPLLSAATEIVAMGQSRALWQQHTFRMARLVRKVLIASGQPDPAKAVREALGHQ
jgi:hypothetical protein